MPVGQTNRRTFIAALGGAAAWPLVAHAQKIWHVGFLAPNSPQDEAMDQTFLTCSADAASTWGAY